MLERENRESARDFMLKNFYKIAVIPKSIQLAETLDKFPYLNDELGKRIFNLMFPTVLNRIQVSLTIVG